MDTVQAEMHFTEFAIQIGRISLTNLYGNPWNLNFDLHIDVAIRIGRLWHTKVQDIHISSTHKLFSWQIAVVVSYS